MSMKLRVDAANKGQVHYVGRPCRTCGSTKRLVCSGGCAECNRVKCKKSREVIKRAIAEAQTRAEGDHATYLEEVYG